MTVSSETRSFPKTQTFGLGERRPQGLAARRGNTRTGEAGGPSKRPRGCFNGASRPAPARLRQGRGRAAAATRGGDGRALATGRHGVPFPALQTPPPRSTPPRSQSPPVFSGVTWTAGPRAASPSRCLQTKVQRQQKTFVPRARGERTHHSRPCVPGTTPGFRGQSGDVRRRGGAGDKSVPGENSDEENFTLKHAGPGTLSVANAGPDDATSPGSSSAPPSLSGWTAACGQRPGTMVCGGRGAPWVQV